MIFFQVFGGIFLAVYFYSQSMVFSGLEFAGLLLYLTLCLLIRVFSHSVPKILCFICLCLFLFFSLQYKPLIFILLPGLILGLIEILPVLPIAIPIVLSLIPFFILKDLRLVYLASFSLALLFSLYRLYEEKKRKESLKRILDLEKEVRHYQEEKERMKSSLREQRLLAVYQERNSIAQKMHDDLGHVITGSIMQLDAASIIGKEDVDRVLGIVSRTRDVLKQGMKGIRETLKVLKPEDSEYGTLEIKTILDQFAQEHHKRCFFEVRQEDFSKVSWKQWQILQINLKEALTNFLKYSSSDTFIFRIMVLNKIIKAEFWNEGIYLKVQHKGMGLSGMEKRTVNGGGTFILDTSKGFSIIMLFNRNK